MLASLSRKTGSPSRSAIRSRIGTSTIGRFTELTATPRSRSIVLGTPTPIASTSGHASSPSRSSCSSVSSSASSVRPVRRLGAAMEDVLVGVDDPDRHLRAPQIGADRSPHVRPVPTAPCRSLRRACSIDSSCLTTGINPSRRATGAARVHRLQVAAQPARPHPQARPLRAERQARARRRRRASRRSRRGRPDERPLWRRVLKWVGIFALGWIALSFLAFAISAQIQKGKLADGIDRRARRQPVPARRPDDPRARHRRALRGLRRPGRVGDRELHRGDHQRPADRQQLQARPLPLRHDHAHPRRRRHLPQALDPARHARRRPRAGPAEDQLRLRVRRRQARRPDGRGHARDSTSTRSRSSTSTASAASSTRSAGSTSTCPTDVCSSVSGGAFNLDLEEGENHLDGFQAITLARTRDNTCGRATSPAGRPRARPVPAADPRRDQGQADEHHQPADELPQGPAHRAGTRRRRWSRAWAP